MADLANRVITYTFHRTPPSTATARVSTSAAAAASPATATAENAASESAAMTNASNTTKASIASKDPTDEPIIVAQAIYEDIPVRLAVSGYLGTIFQLLPFPAEAVRWDLIRSATLELLNPNASPSSAFDVLAALGSSDSGEEATARSLESIVDKVIK